MLRGSEKVTVLKDWGPLEEAEIQQAGQLQEVELPRAYNLEERE